MYATHIFDNIYPMYTICLRLYGFQFTRTQTVFSFKFQVCEDEKESNQSEDLNKETWIATNKRTPNNIG